MDYSVYYYEKKSHLYTLKPSESSTIDHDILYRSDSARVCRNRRGVDER